MRYLLLYLNLNKCTFISHNSFRYNIYFNHHIRLYLVNSGNEIVKLYEKPNLKRHVKFIKNGNKKSNENIEIYKNE